MKTLPDLRCIGRGILDPSRPAPGSAKGLYKRIARLEEGETSLGPILASAPRLARLLGLICVAANMRDTIGLAKLIHQAESELDALGWDWGDAETIINPSPKANHQED